MGGAGARAPLPAEHGPPRRRRRGPSLLRIFLGLAAVLGWVFDASLALRRARRGPWRAEVVDGSMAPGLLPGDWLLLDPTSRRWPRPGSIVVIREPGSGVLAMKRVAIRGSRRGPGGAGADGRAGVGTGRGGASADRRTATPPAELERPLGPREAWLLGDAAAGSIDSRRYGPLDADALVARAWFRYGPPGRIGRLR